MEIINDMKLPGPLLRALANDEYDPGFSDITATGLLTPPRVAELRRRHLATLTTKASRLVPSLVGKAFHSLMEKHAGDGEIAETRLYADCNGTFVGGSVDLQVITQGVKIIDYKVTKVAALKHSAAKWEEQLNIYRWLAWKNDKTVHSLEIIAVLKDWQESRIAPGYPEAPVMVVELPLWRLDQASQFVSDLVDQHKQARTDLPLCSPEDRWIHPDKFRVGRRVFEDHASALAEADGKEDRIKVTKGQPIMCQRNYCLVAEYCTQWKEEQSRDSS